MSSLYQLTTEINSISAKLDQMEEIDSPEGSAFDEACRAELHAQLDALKIESGPKIEGIAKWIRNLEAEESAVDEELKRLRARREARGRKIAWLRSYLLAWMKATDLKKFDATIATISRRAPLKRLEVDARHVLDWPDDIYAAAVIERVEVNKTALKKFGDRALELPGVKEVEGEESLQIR